MPDRTASQSRSKGTAKGNKPGSGRQTDRRIGAGVTRLSSTTHKVTLKDSKSDLSVKKSSSQSNVGSGKKARGSGSATKQVKSDSDILNSKSQNKDEEIDQDNLEIEAVDEAQDDYNHAQETDQRSHSETPEADQERPGGSANSDARLQKSKSRDSLHGEPQAPEKKPFDIHLFTFTIKDLSDKFTTDKFTRVGEDYPVEDLVALIAEVNGAVDEYKKHTLACQQQLELLRDRMIVVRDNIHDSVQTRTFEARQDHEPTLEQKELAVKLARINAEVAHANIELARLVKISAETESAAMEAAQSAAQAQEEAEQAKAETEWRERKAAEKKAEDERRAREEAKRHEEEARQEEEAKKKHEQDWKKREASGHGDSLPTWEDWDPNVYEIRDINGSQTLGCVIRGDPTLFSGSHVTCSPVNQLHSNFTFEQNEELVSPILSLEPYHEDGVLKAPMFVAIPYTANRASMLSREPVVKAEIEGEWQELLTREVSFEEHKEYKFAQAEITEFTNVAVVTRFKRDHITLMRKTSKITFSADHRVSISAPRGSFDNKELFMLQVQPVDSNTVHDLKNKDLSMRGLLNSSPVVTTKWERADFRSPVTITVPCPPNPAKAKKLAEMRAAKEAKMKNPTRNIPDPIDVQEKKERKRQARKPNEPDEEEPVRRTETRWYMGIYGGSDDDENDNLFLLQRFSSGRWAVIPDIKFHQARLDVLQFELEQPIEKFIVLRTRTSTDETIAQTMATTLETALAKRTVKVVLRQRLEDPFDAIAQVIPISRAEKALKQLQEDGFEEGPKVFPDVNVCEGDIIEIGFRGNIRNQDDLTLQFPFNSNMPTSLEFALTEADKYLQRNFSVFRGFVQFFRKFPIKKKPVPHQKTQQKKDEEEAVHEPEPVQYERELLAEILVNIPKYHVEHTLPPAKAPLDVISKSGPVNDEFVHYLATELGDEWYRLAQHLDIRHSRVQAILRNTQSEPDNMDMAKYEMIMTWLKRAPKASNKADALSTALAKTGRNDLAADVRRRYKEFKESSHGTQLRV